MQCDGREFEAGALVVAVVIAWLTRDVAHPTRAGMFWGRLALFAAGYWYACAGGAVLIRRVLDLVPVGESPGKGGITVPASELSRGMVIGVLERAITLTLVFIGQFGALGLVLAAKALTRLRNSWSSWHSDRWPTQSLRPPRMAGRHR